MEYTKSGKTDIEISKVCVGYTIPFGLLHSPAPTDTIQRFLQTMQKFFPKPVNANKRSIRTQRMLLFCFSVQVDAQSTVVTWLRKPGYLQKYNC